MARARNVKPGFFTNEELVELPYETRLLFIGLWTIADREGRLEDRPKRIKMELFPADNVDINDCLNQLQASGFILRYTVGESRYIQVVAFGKHQNPHHKEQESAIPAPDSDAMQGTNTSGSGAMQGGEAPDMPEASPRPDPDMPEASPADSLNSDSLNSDSGKSGARAPAKPKRAMRIPDDFVITEPLRQFARDKGFSETEIDHEVEKFLNYWRSEQKPKKDWPGTWRQWILNAMDRRPANIARFQNGRTDRFEGEFLGSEGLRKLREERDRQRAEVQP